MNVLRLGIFVGLSFITQMAFADIESDREAEKLLATMAMEEAMVQSMSQMVELQLQQNPTLAPYSR